MDDGNKTFYSNNGTSKGDITIPLIDLEKLGIGMDPKDKGKTQIKFKDEINNQEIEKAHTREKRRTFNLSTHEIKTKRSQSGMNGTTGGSDEIM